jgi:hypothetical protein
MLVLHSKYLYETNANGTSQFVIKMKGLCFSEDSMCFVQN